MVDRPAYPGTPLWAKVFGIIVIVVVLVFAILMFTRGSGGRHGPARHTSSGEVDGHDSLSIITEDDSLSEVDR